MSCTSHVSKEYVDRKLNICERVVLQKRLNMLNRKILKKCHIPMYMNIQYSGPQWIRKWRFYAVIHSLNLDWKIIKLLFSSSYGRPTLRFQPRSATQFLVRKRSKLAIEDNFSRHSVWTWRKRREIGSVSANNIENVEDTPGTLSLCSVEFLNTVLNVRTKNKANQ